MTGKDAARAEQIDRVGLGERLDGAGQFFRAHGGAHPFQRHGGGIGEAFEQGRRMDVMSLRIAQALQPFAIIGKAFAQAVAKDLLQMREAVIAEALGEAHQGGGLHAACSAMPATVPKATSSGCARAKAASCLRRFGIASRRLSRSVRSPS